MSQIGAASTVLKKARKPLSCEEIVEAMGKSKRWTSHGGKTTDATLCAATSTRGSDARLMNASREPLTFTAKVSPFAVFRFRPFKEAQTVKIFYDATFARYVLVDAAGKAEAASLGQAWPARIVRRYRAIERAEVEPYHPFALTTTSSIRAPRGAKQEPDVIEFQSLKKRGYTTRLPLSKRRTTVRRNPPSGSARLLGWGNTRL